MEKTGRNKRKRGHLGLPACVFVFRSGRSESQTERGKPNGQRGDSLAYFSPALFVSVAFRSLLRLIFHRPPMAGGPHLMLIEQP